MILYEGERTFLTSIRFRLSYRSWEFEPVACESHRQQVLWQPGLYQARERLGLIQDL